MKVCAGVLPLFAALWLLAMPARAQFATTANPLAPGLGDSNVFNYQQWPVVGQVKTLRGDPVAHARVEVMPANTGAEFRVLMTDLQGKFDTVYMLKTAMDSVVAYVEVHFKGLPEGFWVPKEVTVSVDWNGKHLRNEHHYSEFKFFQVEATEKQGKPNELSQKKTQ